MKPDYAHIVLIILDTHRRDRLGIYGQASGATPNLDAFAEQAVIFENAISPGQWTVPAHASMFSGEFPTTHGMTQPSDGLDAAFPTLAELLRRAGYRATGFCNNPLVGVLDNHLKRGFETFYNYGGAVPSKPAREAQGAARLLAQVWEKYTQMLRRISYPVQNAFARSEHLLNLTLNPMLVPLWTRYANFKGDTARSIQDTSSYLRRRLAPGSSDWKRPQLVFLNLMETHLPFTPPEPFLTRFAPVFKDERAARDFMRLYNSQALRWLLPMEAPFEELEARTLNEMYTAEAAYQDHLLGELLEELDQPHHRDNTLVMITADHGEMLGEHHLMGHGLGVYEELIHVPLLVRFPGQKSSKRVVSPVSTAQIFFTGLEAGGRGGPAVWGEKRAAEAERLSLRRWFGSRHPVAAPAVSEAYPPNNVLQILAKQRSPLIERFNVRSVFRAMYDGRGNKLVQAEGAAEWLFRPAADPNEREPLSDEDLGLRASRLRAVLTLFLERARERRPEGLQREKLALDDERLRSRLRSLGYLE